MCVCVCVCVCVCGVAVVLLILILNVLLKLEVLAGSCQISVHGNLSFISSLEINSLNYAVCQFHQVMIVLGFPHFENSMAVLSS